MIESRHAAAPSSATRFFKNNAPLLITAITVFCILIASAYIGFSYSAERSSYRFTGKTQTLSVSDFQIQRNGEWMDSLSSSCGSGLKVSGSDVLRLRIPEQLDGLNTLSFLNIGASVTVYLNEKEVCRSSDTRRLYCGHFSRGEWLTIDLTEADAGEYLIFQIDDGSSGIMRDFTISNQAGLLHSAWLSSLPRLLISVIFLLFLMIECLYFFVSRQEVAKKHIYLNGFLFTLSLWLFSESRLMGYLFQNSEMFCVISSFLFSLLPLFLCLYVKEEFPRQSKWFTLYSILFFLVFLIMLITILSSKTAPITFLPIFFAELLLIIVTGLIFAIAHKNGSGSVWSIILFSVAALTAVLAFFAYDSYCYSQDAFGHIVLFGAWCIWCIAMIARAVKDHKMQSDVAMLGYYKKLAYTDYLTGLQNKAAYDRDLPVIDSEHPALAAIMFDSNNLKEINDLYGHESGDKLLRSTAYCLSTAFGDQNPVYRVGGDEFIVLLPANKEEDIQELITRKLNKFNELVVRNNENSEWKINIAYGYTLRRSGDHISAKAMVSSAETIMYRNKRNEKRKQSRHNDDN